MGSCNGVIFRRSRLRWALVNIVVIQRVDYVSGTTSSRKHFRNSNHGYYDFVLLNLTQRFSTMAKA